MFWSLIPLIGACIVLAALVGQCSFQPKGPADGAVPTYDVTTALRADATVLHFPIRLPALPAGWKANSGGRGSIEQGPHRRRREARQRRDLAGRLSGPVRQRVRQPHPERRRRDRTGPVQYYSYSRIELGLRINWKRRLFNTTYYSTIEMAVTD